MPFARIAHIHSAYQVLPGLLSMQGIDEVGADQLVPFSILATVYVNPLGLAATFTFFSQFIEPLSGFRSPISHQEEYSVVHFMSTYHYLTERMEEDQSETLREGEREKVDSRGK
jgi:hypothetical protein